LLTGARFIGWKVNCELEHVVVTGRLVQSHEAIKKWPTKANMEEHMKNFWTMLVLGGLMALVAVMPAAAQVQYDGAGLDVSFTAPMAFFAGDTKMPAGPYHVTQGVGPGMLVVRGEKDKHEVILPYQAIASSTPAKGVSVSFNKYGKSEYLNSVTVGNVSNTQGSWVLKITPSAGEQAAAKAASATPHAVPGTTTKK